MIISGQYIEANYWFHVNNMTTSKYKYEWNFIPAPEQAEHAI